MSHLSPAELVDAADGTLPSGRAAHVSRCERCAGEVAAMRATLDHVRLAPARTEGRAMTLEQAVAYALSAL